MDLQKIFNYVQSNTQTKVIGFALENAYPLLFFSLLLRRQDGSQIVNIDMTEYQEDEIKAQLETTFLGIVRTYRLTGLHELTKAAVHKWLNYFNAYQGPNYIFFVVSQETVEPYRKDVSNGLSFMNIPAYIQKSLFIDLFTYLERQPSVVERRYIDQLYMRTEKIPLDTACLLVHYLKVLGSTAQEFFTHWLDKLVIPDKSLFTLSQYFFAKQSTHFLHMWSSIKDEYPEQFWISFWSEQVWRALFYCQCMQQRNIAEAKKIGYRLPFSFLQKDYRNCNIEALQNAHQALYELDGMLKNGGSAIGLDLFFLSYFAL
jgi:hypothetical protein